MKNPKAKFFKTAAISSEMKEQIRIGQQYQRTRNDKFFYVESEGAQDEFQYSHWELKNIVHLLKMAGAAPSQIDNIGTLYPTQTEKVHERDAERIKKELNLPLIIVNKVPLEKEVGPIDREYGVRLEHPYFIQLGEGSDLGGMFSLGEVHKVLNGLGCSLDNLKFRELHDYGYVPLNDKEKWYILRQTEPRKDQK